MLEKIDLSLKMDKGAYKEEMSGLASRIFDLQKMSWDQKIPVILLFEGWDAAGKGTSIQKLASALDPRGFKLFPIRAARTYEKKRPWLWRFWMKIPGRGEWAIFDRSWYGRVLVERVEKLIPESDCRLAYRDIVDFERTLADDGALILKFFLHISKNEQKRRFNKLEKDPLTSWHVSDEDWEHHRHYDDWLVAYEEVFERTDAEYAPWIIIEATDRRHTWTKIFKTIIRALEDRLEQPHVIPSHPQTTPTVPSQAEHTVVVALEEQVGPDFTSEELLPLFLEKDGVDDEPGDNQEKRGDSNAADN